MKMNKIWFSAVLALCLTGCQKLQFDDPSSFTLEEAKAITPDYYFKVASSAFSSVLGAANEGYNYGAGLRMLADESATTNRVQEWWDFTIEPRKRLNNTQSYGGYNQFMNPHTSFYLANLNANKVILGLDAGNPGIDATGKDRTQEVYAFAYLVKGMAQGYLGAIFDRGIIANQDLGVAGEQAFPHSYKQLIESGVSFIDKAIIAANAAPSITSADFYVNIVLDKAKFIQFANSMAARLLASIPRDKAEATALGNTFWTRVNDYASKGLTTNFTTVWQSGGFSNSIVVYEQNWLTTGGGYHPADIKIAYLADKTGTYPNSYPEDPTIVLGPVQTDDKRFATYLKYTTDFGYFRVDRGRNLFSNYNFSRWRFNNANSMTVVGAINPVFLTEECRLLRAEAKMFMGDLAGAAAELNAATAERKSLGGLPNIAATAEAITNTLHYEYSISIGGAGGSTNPWAFMRRNNLLQIGTPTEMPIPEGQMLLTPDAPYTFGGKEFAGEKGKWGETATAGVGGWKPSR